MSKKVKVEYPLKQGLKHRLNYVHAYPFGKI